MGSAIHTSKLPFKTLFFCALFFWRERDLEESFTLAAILHQNPPQSQPACFFRFFLSPSCTIALHHDLLPPFKIMPSAVPTASPDGGRPAAAPGPALAASAPPAVDAVAADHRARSQRWQQSVKKRAVRRFVNKRRPRRSGRDPAADLAVDPDVLGDATVASLETIASHSAAAMEVDVNAPAKVDLSEKAAAELPDNPTLEDYIALCSRLVWPGIEALRPAQMEVLTKLFADANEDERKLMVNLMTGVGKTHVIRVLGALLKGVHLIIHPLLVLTADQVVKFLEGTDDYGAIEVHNLDDLAGTTEAYRKQFVKRLKELRGDMVRVRRRVLSASTTWRRCSCS